MRFTISRHNPTAHEEAQLEKLEVLQESERALAEAHEFVVTSTVIYEHAIDVNKKARSEFNKITK